MNGWGVPVEIWEDDTLVWSGSATHSPAPEEKVFFSREEELEILQLRLSGLTGDVYMVVIDYHRHNSVDLESLPSEPTELISLLEKKILECSKKIAAEKGYEKA
jgi:hypothetical protein